MPSVDAFSDHIACESPNSWNRNHLGVCIVTIGRGSHEDPNAIATVVTSNNCILGNVNCIGGRSLFLNHIFCLLALPAQQLWPDQLARCCACTVTMKYYNVV